MRGTGVPPPPCPAAVTPLPPSATYVPGWGVGALGRGRAPPQWVSYSAFLAFGVFISDMGGRLVHSSGLLGW